MKRQGILNSEISRVLTYMGHTDQICIGDCGLPIPEETERIDGLDLTALKEFKRSANGVVELKFIDRLEVARQLLERLPGESRLDPAESFFQLTKEG